MVIPIDIDKNFKVGDKVISLKSHRSEEVYIPIGQEYTILLLNCDDYDNNNLISVDIGIYDIILNNIDPNDITFKISYKEAKNKVKIRQIKKSLFGNIKYNCVNFKDVPYSTFCEKYGGVCNIKLECCTLPENKHILTDHHRILLSELKVLERGYKLKKLLKDV